MPGDLLVRHGIALVQNHEKQIKSTHNGGTHRHIRLECLRAVITPKHRVGWRKKIIK